MRRIAYIVSLLSVLCCFTAAGQKNAITITSPDGNYVMQVYGREKQVCYTLSYKTREVIHESPLGILETGRSSGHAVKAPRIGARSLLSTRDADTTWKPVYGERAVVRDHYKEHVIVLGQDLRLVVRAYDEGIAFRYLFTGEKPLCITGEATGYTLPAGTISYYNRHPQAVYDYIPLDAWPDKCEAPLLLELPDATYMLLTEAGNTRHAKSRFTMAGDVPGRISWWQHGDVTVNGPYETPWRVIMMADEAGELIEHNDIILNLNPPNEIADVSWIRPGKVMRDVTISTAGAKRVVDFAVARGLQYVHLDAGWYGPEGDATSDATTVTPDPARNKNPRSLNMAEVVSYAAARGVGVILYVNQRALRRQLDTILPLYKSWGVAGIKFGFVQVGTREQTEWLHEAIKACARHQLMVNVHDEYRPTGFTRTYPNLMTQEGLHGNEEFPSAAHNVTLPFTRFPQGAADYTICYYRRPWDATTRPDTTRGLKRARLLRTTAAHQLAMAAVYYSPWQYMYWYDAPSDSRDEPELEFFDRVPTVWDDTRVLVGEVGKYVSIARRAGRDWFIGSMNNETRRAISIPLTFLDSTKKYTARLYYDDTLSTTRTRVSTRTMTVTRETTLSYIMEASGGHAAWLEEQREFVHPGIVHTRENIATMKKLVVARQEPAYTTFLQLAGHPCARADYAPRGPFPVISRDGGHAHVKSAMESDFSAVYLNAVMWLLTDNKAHAVKSLEILQAYAATLDSIPPTNDAPLLVGLEGWKIMYAMEALRHTCPWLTGADLAPTEAMFQRLFIPVMNRFFETPAYTNGNWGPIVCKAYMAAGVYFDNRGMYKRARDFYLGANDNGTVLHYIDAATGQVQESGRDQGHCMLGVGAMATVCEIAWKQGDDLYGALHDRLLKGYEYVARYNLGNDVPFTRWRDVTGKYSDWETVSDKGRGNFKPVFQIAYNHYVRRRGMEMPYTRQVIEKMGVEGYDRDQPGFGGLLFFD